MNDDKQAKEYNIEGGSVLHLVSAGGSLPGVYAGSNTLVVAN
jgi:hypothetical protein